MSDALAYLRARQRAGRLRFIRRRLGTVRGVLATVGTVVCVAAVFGVQLVSFWMRDASVEAASVARFYAPVLGAVTLVGAFFAQGLALRPAEVDFLIGGPVTSRELLGHYLRSRMETQVLGMLWVAMYGVPMAALRVAGGAAVVLWFAYAFVLTLAATVLRALADERLRPPARRALRLGVRAALAAVVGSALLAALPAGGLAPGLVAAADSAGARLIALPALPFTYLFTARTAPAALGWGAVCTALLLVTAGLLVRADVDLRERSLTASARLELRRARLRGLRAPVRDAEPAVRRAPARGVRIPELAFLGRAAPITRRQLAELARDRGRIVAAVAYALFFNGVLAVGPALGIVRSAGEMGQPVGAAGLLAVFVLIVPILTTAHLRLDFRRDLDRMAALRALPISPMAVTVGQLFGPAALLTLTQALCLALLAVVTRVIPSGALLATLLALAPLVWTVVALDNAIFLVMPYRPRASGTPAGMGVMARGYLTALVKFILVGISVGAAAAAGYAAWTSASHSLLAAGAAAAAALTLIALAATWAVSRAFMAFDVAQDVPA